MYENYERDVQPMMYESQPTQGTMYPQTGQYPQAMPSQMYPTGVQGTYQQPMQSDIKHDCRRYMNYHVQTKMRDGSDVEGIITDMDENEMEMLVPEEVDEEEVNNQRQQFGYGGGYGGGYGRRRFRRFRRRRFPFFNIIVVRPYPYYYPYPYQY